MAGHRENKSCGLFSKNWEDAVELQFQFLMGSINSCADCFPPGRQQRALLFRTEMTGVGDATCSPLHLVMVCNTASCFYFNVFSFLGTGKFSPRLDQQFKKKLLSVKHNDVNTPL